MKEKKKKCRENLLSSDLIRWLVSLNFWFHSSAINDSLSLYFSCILLLIIYIFDPVSIDVVILILFILIKIMRRRYWVRHEMTSLINILFLPTLKHSCWMTETLMILRTSQKLTAVLLYDVLWFSIIKCFFLLKNHRLQLKFMTLFYTKPLRK